MDGIINIYKEKGFTSHDVVAKLRGILKMKRIGHTGTLDPEAEGVLPVCLGTATRLCEMFTDKKKEYRAVMVFGAATDTEDMTGRIIREMPVVCGEQELRALAENFPKAYEQIPPMYSAIKVDGKKLYELAREGKVIERKGRPVEVDSITVESVALDEHGFLKGASITVECGKGTYIRSLCRDIGEMLGTCACMKSLIRTKSGPFSANDALRLSEAEQLVRREELEKHIITVEQIFTSCGAFLMKAEWDKLLKNGNPVPEAAVTVTKPEREADGTKEFPADWFRAYTSDGSFLGVYRQTGKNYVPVKMFL